MIRNNLYLVTVLTNKKIEKLKYYVDFSIYHNVECLHQHICTIVGKDIIDNYNIFYFYNGKILTEKVEIELFDKTIIAYLVPKTKNINCGFNILNNSILNIFNRIINGNRDIVREDYDDNNNNDNNSDNDDYDVDIEVPVNDINIDLDSIFNMYQEQFLAMIGMGFSDETRVSMALQVTGGDIDHAVNYYLSNA